MRLVSRAMLDPAGVSSFFSRLCTEGNGDYALNHWSPPHRTALAVLCQRGLGRLLHVREDVHVSLVPFPSGMRDPDQL